jgi:adenylate cyclase
VHSLNDSDKIVNSGTGKVHEATMSDIGYLVSLVKEAEIYRGQGLLEESRETYARLLAFVQYHKSFMTNRELIHAVEEKIKTVDRELMDRDLRVEIPDLSEELQGLISKLFSFSSNQDVAAIEGAVALAKFGQYEKALAELQKLIDRGILISADRTASQMAEYFSSIISALSEAYGQIRQQSTQLVKYAKELSQSYERMKEEEMLREKLSRYVGKNLVDNLVGTQDGVLFANERKEVTVLFADIRSFTAISERMVPEELVSMLNEFFTGMVDVIFKYDGILDKFIGDQIMAVFGILPAESGHPHRDALRSALEMQAFTQRMMKLRKHLGKEVFEIGIGINSGSAVVGNIGSRNRMDYTVIGDSVNVAERLQRVAEGGRIIVGGPTYEKVRDDFPMRKRGTIRIKNRSEPVTCYEVRATKRPPS